MFKEQWAYYNCQLEIDTAPYIIWCRDVITSTCLNMFSIN